jgi:hypothetical protein
MKKNNYDLFEITKSGNYGMIGQQEKLEGKDFCISYAIGGSGPTGDETALVVEKKDNTHFYILNGDWREDHAPLIGKGLKACLKLFKDNKDEYMNFWSDDI